MSGKRPGEEEHVFKHSLRLNISLNFLTGNRKVHDNASPEFILVPSCLGRNVEFSDYPAYPHICFYARIIPRDLHSYISTRTLTPRRPVL
jgi:hypothetical protein